MRLLKQLEDKNWTAVEAGELQEEEDEKTSFGVREYDLETGGKEKTASDIWLERRSGDNARSQGSLRNRSSSAARGGPAQTRPQPSRESDDGELSLKIGIGGQSPGVSGGATASGEPKANQLLGHDPVPGGLRDTFSGGNPAAEPRPRGDLGLRTIEGPTGTRTPSLGGGDSLGFGRDTGSRAGFSTSPGLTDTPRSQSSFAAPGGSSGMGLPGGRYNSPGLFDSSPGPRSGSGFGNSASPLTPRNQTGLGTSRDSFAPPARPSSGR